MRLRVMVFSPDEHLSRRLASQVSELGHEVHSVSQPGYCGVYQGQGCTFDTLCCDAMLVDQQLLSGNPYGYLADLEQKCPGSMANRAVVATQMSPEELIRAISLHCKIMFKPVLNQELDDWFQEVAGRTSADRRLAVLA